MITGGSGYLAHLLAHWLADRGCRELVLVSRRGAEAPEAEELQAALLAKNCRAQLESCDLTDEEPVDRLLARHPQIRGVFHLAGQARMAPLDEWSESDLRQEMAAKVQGAWNLHRALQRHEIPLETFVLYGSIAGFWGSRRQPAYSAANAALNGLVQIRLAAGLPATLVAWGRWEDDGVVAPQAADYLERRGVKALETRMALETLGCILNAKASGLAVANIDWKPFVESFCSARQRPLLEDFQEQPTALGQEAPGTDRRVIQELLGRPDHEQLARLCDLVCQLAARVLGLSSSANVPEDQPLQELGLDSLMSVELKNRLAALTGEKLPVTFVLDYPDPQGIAQALLERLRARENPELSLEVLQRKLAEIPMAELQQSGLAEAILSYRASTIPVPSQSEASESLPPSSEGLGEGDVVRILKGLLESRGDD
jgi:NAD(P)-dependent dehydrogenase (short-subunit alcohol dehydrogenase family)/acyl carrier protein